MAVESTLLKYKANLKDLARPNRFLFSIPGAPSGVAGFAFTEDMQYHVKAASLPGRTVGDIATLFWFGVNYKIAGDPVFDDVTLVFLNDSSFKLKKTFESWLHYVSDAVANKRGDPESYKAIFKLDQIGRNNEILATYYLHGTYPKSMDPIELSHETNDTIEEFSVNFSIDLWTNDAKPGAGESKAG